MPTPTCADNPVSTWRYPSCVSALSKNLHAHLRLVEKKRERCADRRCVSLKTLHVLEMEMDPYDCDSPTGKRLNGVITVRRLVTIFDRDSSGRGVHCGDFLWSNGPNLRIIGRLSGITNAGLLRRPFKDCEECRAPFILYGRLCGRIVSTKIAALEGCQVLAMYRIALDTADGPTKDPIEAAVGPGTLEGAVHCACRS